VKERVRGFLDDLDRALVAAANGRVLHLYHIGRSALVWEYDYPASTRDIDVLRPKGEADLVDLALQLFGNGTPKAAEHDLYLEIVEEAFPPVPGGYERRSHMVPGPWQVLRLFHLDPHDLAATKLRRFSPKDRTDIRQLCDLGLLNPATLEDVLEAAFRWNLDKDGDDYRDIPFRNLRTVQRYLRGEIAEF
jgi:Nucleotidyltransferase of unknown function (DUF6036)